MKKMIAIMIVTSAGLTSVVSAQTVDIRLEDAVQDSRLAAMDGDLGKARDLAAKALEGFRSAPAPAVHVNLAGPGGSGNTSDRAHSAAPAPKAAKPYYPPPPYPGYQPFPGYQPHPGYPQQPGYQPYPGQQPFPGYQPYPQYPLQPPDLTAAQARIVYPGLAGIGAGLLLGLFCTPAWIGAAVTVAAAIAITVALGRIK